MPAAQPMLTMAALTHGSMTPNLLADRVGRTCPPSIGQESRPGEEIAADSVVVPPLPPAKEQEKADQRQGADDDQPGEQAQNQKLHRAEAEESEHDRPSGGAPRPAPQPPVSGLNTNPLS